MIVSHRYKFIFLKTRKTGGTSIEIALSKFCGPQDVITPISPTDERLRTELGYRGRQNNHVSIRRYTLPDYARLVVPGTRRAFRRHTPATRARRDVGEACWKKYFKFSVERDPWDKAVSLYYWRARGSKPRISFAQFIDTVDESHLSNFEIYGVGDSIVADHVIRYENLHAELAHVAARLNLPEPLELPRAKSGYREDSGRYWDLFSPDAVARVAHVCRREIKAFGYAGGPSPAGPPA
jgi:hypothetical protein